MRRKLNNANVIRSVSYDQHQILKWILELYIPSGQFDYDPTYSKGVFYKTDVPEPKYKSCLTDEGLVDFFADTKNLPVKSESLNSICFDPPFTMGSGPSVKNPKTGSNIINRRFGIIKNEKELLSFYYSSLIEFERILKPKGVLVFKCQDCIVSSKQIMSHAAIITAAARLGLYPKDLFILTKKSVILSGKVKKQQHARKFHSYFLVFIKETPKVSYI